MTLILSNYSSKDNMTDIIKNNGETELFDPEKLRHSLRRSGASDVVVNEITKQIEESLKDGMTTSDIYQNAFKILDRKERKPAVKYSIRRSILNMGPSGFPFEKFVAELFEAKGYKTETGVFVKGKCIEHELDMVAYKENKLILAEVKFHNKLEIKTDTKVALYIKARLDDLREEEFTFGGDKRNMTTGLLVTNTKFTHTAKKYVKCAGGMELISWDYPEKGNLYDMIEETATHPITCIPQLTKRNKEELLEKGIVNCQSLKDNTGILKEIGIKDPEIENIMENIDMICSHDSHKE
jgi:hypothetical protein